MAVGGTTATRSLSSVSSCCQARSDEWFTDELEVAAKNAEINRTIKVPKEEYDSRRNRVCTKTARIGTVSCIILSRRKYGVKKKNDKGIVDSQFVAGPSQPSILNIIDDWSVAVLSIFSEKQSITQDTRASNQKSLIVY